MAADIRRTKVAPDGNEGFIVTTQSGGTEYEYHFEIVSQDAPREVKLNVQYENTGGEVIVDEDQTPSEAVEKAVASKDYEIVE